MITLRRFLGAVLMASLGVGAARAVDPLPAELESASVAKQNEYWLRTSKDSWAQRTKVAEHRYQAALAYKRQLQAQMEEHQAHVQSQIERAAAGQAAGQDAGSGGSSWNFYAVVAGAMCGGVVFMHRQLRKADDI